VSAPDPRCDTPEQHAPPSVPRQVLIVDDSRLQRKILRALLRRWGYIVTEAESGIVALELCRSQNFDLVLSDWMMPEMLGPEFCAQFRQLKRESYGYFLLLTSKSDVSEIAQGLDAGADDFLTKPVNAEELRARLTAGERILAMQEELVAKNHLITKTLTEISHLYDSLDRDLIEARKLQQSLVKERFRRFGPSQVSLLLRPAGHVGGDLVGFFPINATRLAVFSIDVSGHGVTSALMTARLAGYLSSGSAEQNIALTEESVGANSAHSPDKIAALLNHLLLTEMQTENYFTMVFADIDLVTGAVAFVQAGHPHPAIQRADGQIEYIGNGGPPIGLIEDIGYETVFAKLETGDRLLLISDGITECPDPDGTLLDTDGFSELLQKNAKISGTSFMETLIWDLTAYAEDADFPDDVSAALFEFGGPAAYETRL
jgi:sigma-B regulation protein RsbU (phosphoserine phosphatase)